MYMKKHVIRQQNCGDYYSGPWDESYTDKCKFPLCINMYHAMDQYLLLN
jgi:hypothetical protein